MISMFAKQKTQMTYQFTWIIELLNKGCSRVVAGAKAVVVASIATVIPTVSQSSTSCLQ